MKKLLLLSVICLMSIVATAYDFAAEVNGTTFYFNKLGYSKWGNEAVEITYESLYAKGYDGDIVIPSQVSDDNKTYNVVQIGEKAFENCQITGLTFPEASILTIGDYAFASCRKLRNVVVPESVTSIGYQCFENSGSRGGEIEIRCNVENYAFINMNYAKVTIAENVKTFNYGSLSCSMDEWYIYSDAVTNNTFTRDRNLYLCSFFQDSGGNNISLLQKVVMGGNVKVIGNFAFIYLNSAASRPILHTVEMEEGVTTIGQEAFSYQKCLGNVSIPSTVTAIGDQAFNVCDAMREIYIPENIEIPGFFVYSSCPNIKTIKAHSARGVFNIKRSVSDIIPQIEVYAYTQEIYDAYVNAGFQNVFLVGGNSSSIDEDVNHDGQVNSLDVLKVYKYMQSH